MGVPLDSTVFHYLTYSVTVRVEKMAVRLPRSLGLWSQISQANNAFAIRMSGPRLSGRIRGDGQVDGCQWRVPGLNRGIC